MDRLVPVLGTVAVLIALVASLVSISGSSEFFNGFAEQSALDGFWSWS